MKILLATGVYPPEIGGPATYAENVARELVGLGHQVSVVTYGEESVESGKQEEEILWPVIRVSKRGGPIARWRRYAKALKEHGEQADVIYAFSAVSCGIPLRMARLKKPKKFLRLGGDFVWERYTDWGGKKGLRDFYHAYPRVSSLLASTLRSFDHVVFSTAFQRSLYERIYTRLPERSVIENAIPKREISLHAKHDPCRLLFLGRFVRFKNIDRLLHAVALLPHMQLTLVGDGPLISSLPSLIQSLSLDRRVSILPSVHGEDKKAIFQEHDLLVLPSLTEISPHVAIEARAYGIPVLLTQENGLSDDLQQGMIVRPLDTRDRITRAILQVEHAYDEFARDAAAPVLERTWANVCDEHLKLFSRTVDAAVSKEWFAASTRG